MRFEESGQWEKAITRANEFDVEPDLVDRRLTRNRTARHFTVYSPRSERSHPVLVEVTTFGEASVLCLCEAGRRDIACWHAAACLMASGHLRPAPTRESRLRGRRSLALLNDREEEYDQLSKELDRIGAA
jgi:hypothetical protein